ncbi:hypothetical protein TOPH_03271 [Tolypocladium ophioglossoides CBS 100239]|uniref:Rhodopsin domain-containing protein n=1 Tax=Tolypocladium ophioglossoides (strain CBS 100239) TaxID=1163406 RepID=A0A0L0NE82_TOLOC|nr:hypothetical protein TOPH_03271 [Tolypocladium ophioglossoides CBS 100239]
MQSSGSPLYASNYSMLLITPIFRPIRRHRLTSTLDIAAQNLTDTVCHNPRRDRSASYNAANFTMGASFSSARSLGPDDWAIVVTILVQIPCTAINLFGLTAHGLGKDAWTLEPTEVSPFAQYFRILEILYVTLISLIKLSLTLFYLTIFPGLIIRRLLWGTAVFHVVFGIIFVLKTIFQCTPIDFYSTDYSEYAAGGCYTDITACWWIHAALNVAADFWLIAISLSQVHKLGLHWKKKVGAVIMFMTGILVTVVSILRLRTIVNYSKNPTWDLWPIALWSTIEINVGITCICLPSVRLILARMWPRVFDSDTMQHTSRSGYGQWQSSSSNIMDPGRLELSSTEIKRMDMMARASKPPGPNEATQ